MEKFQADKYKVACPICGKPLFSSKSADIEDMNCPKCKNTFAVKVSEGSLQIRETPAPYLTNKRG